MITKLDTYPRFWGERKAMLDFAKDKRFWENVRQSDEFKWHREEIKELYDEAFKVEPRAHSAEDILGNDDKGLWRLQFDHLQSSALMALIYPEKEALEYDKDRLTVEIEELKYLIDCPVDREYIVRVAREKLGLALPDEIVYYNDYNDPKK